jgi:hypothetical protein
MPTALVLALLSSLPAVFVVALARHRGLVWISQSFLAPGDISVIFPI